MKDSGHRLWRMSGMLAAVVCSAYSVQLVMRHLKWRARSIATNKVARFGCHDPSLLPNPPSPPTPITNFCVARVAAT